MLVFTSVLENVFCFVLFFNTLFFIEKDSPETVMMRMKMNGKEEDALSSTSMPWCES